MTGPKLPLLVASLLLGACVVNTNPPEFADEPPPPPPARGSSSSGDTAEWRKLGEKIVNGKNDHDDILVGRREGGFRALRLHIENDSLRMHDVVVEFTDGSKFSPRTRVQFAEGVTSNVIDLPGGRRHIKRVGLRYSDVKGGGAARVEVWGR